MSSSVLVVEGEAGIRRFLEYSLKSHGYPVLSAANGEEALALYARRQEEISFVMLDAQLPGIDGPQTLEAIQKINPDVRCCFMRDKKSGYCEEDLRSRGEAVLRKPFSCCVLWEVVRQFSAICSPM